MANTAREKNQESRGPPSAALAINAHPGVQNLLLAHNRKPALQIGGHVRPRNARRAQ